MSDELIKKVLLNRTESGPDQMAELNDALSSMGPEELAMLAKLYSGQESKSEPKDQSYKSFLPEPGICFKTKNLQSNQKIFLNICQSPEINAPKDITEQELLKIIEQEDPESAAFQFRVPMSLGEAHVELDNAGAACVAYDVCVSPEFMQKVHKYPTFMGFLMSIVIEGLEAKYSIKIDKNCKLLKNKKFMGQIKEQFIRVRSKPLIAEVDQDNEKKLETPNKPKSQTPKYKIYREPQEGDQVEFLVAEIELPNIISANSLQLDVGEDRILLNTRSQIYHLDIYLPHSLKQEECGAQFDKKSKILTITMPVFN